MWLIWKGPQGIRLGSMPRQEYLWPPGWATPARCLSSYVCDSSPGEGCTCGYYGLRADAFGADMLKREHAPAAALGKVKLWGKVVVCERGWRSEFAYPSELYLPRDAPWLTDIQKRASDLRDYGVTVAIEAVEQIIERARRAS
jgi:hypothetical protein